MRSTHRHGGGERRMTNLSCFTWRNGRKPTPFVNESKLAGAPSPTLGFNGGYVDAGWVFTGEPIP
jgi:hypothetical protein